MENMEIAESFKGRFKNKKVVITGNTGFKGSWLTLWLIGLGAKVVGISHKRNLTDPSLFQILGLEEKIRFYETDINEFEILKDILLEEEPDFIFHLAAQAIVSESYTDTLGTLKSNIMGTANVLESLKRYSKPCTVIMVTSDKCYHNQEWIWGYRENDPMGGKDPYSASKGAADIIIQSYVYSFFSGNDSSIKVATVRAGNVIGGGDFAVNRIVPDCFRAWSQGHPVLLRNPQSVRPWQHVLESLSGYLKTALLLSEGEIANGEIYNFGPSVEQSCTVHELVKGLSKTYNNEGGEWIKADKTVNFKEANLLRLNWDKAYYQLGWKPVLGFEQTITITSDWYKNYKLKNKDELLAFTLQQIKEYSGLAKFIL
jgi:CDP-glucose 4,6-dehydratase